MCSLEYPHCGLPDKRQFALDCKTPLSISPLDGAIKTCKCHFVIRAVNKQSFIIESNYCSLVLHLPKQRLIYLISLLQPFTSTDHHLKHSLYFSMNKWTKGFTSMPVQLNPDYLTTCFCLPFWQMNRISSSFL